MSTIIVPDDRDVLPSGYTLQSYKLSEVVGRGSYGITYLANDQYLNRKVAIKEYLPREYATRGENLVVSPISDNQQEMFAWGLNNFLLEARTLAKFNHRNIIKVIGVVEQNNTAYMIMEFEEGSDLSNVYKEAGHLSERQLLHYFVPIIEGLSVVHKLGFIHRDIKPSNIYVRSDSSTVLLDFGSARQTIENESEVLTTLVTAGFAPYEQYHQSKFDQGPWSDIYSIGATLYYCITGNKPADALLRGSSLLKQRPDPYIPIHQCAKKDYSKNFLLAIDHALSFSIDARPADALLWSKMLSGIKPARPFPKTSVNHLTDNYPRTIPMESKSLATMEAVLASTPRTVENHRFIVSTREIINSVAHKLQQLKTSIISIFTTMVGDSNRKFSNTTFVVVTLLAIPFIVIPIVLNYNNAENEEIEFVTAKAASEDITKPPINTIRPGNKSAEKKVETPEIKKTVAITAPATTENTKKTPVTITPPAQQKLSRKQVVEYAKQVVIKDLLTQAQRAVADKRYSVPSKNNAIYYYKKILNLQANHPIAIAGLSDIKDRYIEIVEKFISLHQWKTAQKNIEKIAAMSDKHTDIIKNLNAELEAEKQKVAQIINALNQANFLYKKSRLTRPEKENALNYYNQVLKLEPENKQALSRIDKIFGKLSIILEKQIAAKRVKKAKRTFNILQSIRPKAPIISELSPIITALEFDYYKIQALLSQAKNDFINNRISLPKNNNAFEKYTAALIIDKNNNQAKAGIKRIFTYYVSNYYRQIDNSKFASAKNTLQTLQNIGYGKKKLATLRKFAKLEKNARIDTASIQHLLGKMEKGLDTRNIKALNQISVFKSKKKKYITDILNNYSDYSIDIVDKKYSKKYRRTTARIILSNLEAVDEELYDVPDKIKINIKIKKNQSKKWKIYW